MSFLSLGNALSFVQDIYKQAHVVFQACPTTKPFQGGIRGGNVWSWSSPPIWSLCPSQHGLGSSPSNASKILLLQILSQNLKLPDFVSREVEVSQYEFFILIYLFIFCCCRDSPAILCSQLSMHGNAAADIYSRLHKSNTDANISSIT